MSEEPKKAILMCRCGAAVRTEDIEIKHNCNDDGESYTDIFVWCHNCEDTCETSTWGDADTEEAIDCIHNQGCGFFVTQDDIQGLKTEVKITGDIRPNGPGDVLIALDEVLVTIEESELDDNEEHIVIIFLLARALVGFVHELPKEIKGAILSKVIDRMIDYIDEDDIFYDKQQIK